MIYTKKGDDGRTSILKKKEGRVATMSKASPLIEAIGSVDEANSYLGIITSELRTSSYAKVSANRQNLKNIEKIQKNLFTIGSILAGFNFESKSLKTKELEKEIDLIDEKLPKLTGFILPGGSTISAQIMYARALVRRMERKIVRLSDRLGNNKFQEIITYINRLSDYLFVLGRFQNSLMGIREEKLKVK